MNKRPLSRFVKLPPPASLPHAAAVSHPLHVQTTLNFFFAPASGP